MNSNSIQPLLTLLLENHSLQEVAHMTGIHTRTLYRLKNDGTGSNKTQRHLLNFYLLKYQHKKNSYN